MIERLQKYMAHCGVASRRKCEYIILQGRVRVNGQVIDKLGFKVDTENDLVMLDNNNIVPEQKKVYIALNKPEGYVSTVRDEKNRKTILDLVKVDERIYPIGRLDYDTSGLILLTNDGDIYNKIIHPKSEKNKVYIAEVSGVISNEDINKFENGLNIGNYITSKASLKILRLNNNSSVVNIIIHEGKNRQIRKMCKIIGHQVITLKRIKIGKIELGNLKKGEWRYLTDTEIKYISM
ncbi:pseudouridine synthase [Clostridium tyrobutyricum]|mgnify:CR=1 FL=1|jgi:23S rRNA pseudouridine2605 synthase|uniref:Pseudouridine synthase n=1 Tax=Clostridium tyrobutyricum DIVETGP TaxID=1408889 RepID=W6N3L0_CLOTY|nr:pseudouridine synthase [Clostridium tyrobutyricum]AND84794.1 pseudouridine synthase [Clostridium tyrobutyricum]ANP69380.1 pseudouridine synthase [Clostridium tyrobutyricum]MBR9647682.1 rRNA pseudouridine synthase [Clostridium tyrobutyricum]MBV4415976.1 rRNA pseudouridine synthase [Clostridium tyrobutyricum]MBV4422082.1 rRNA pseudouridine synthase [Clostridium tyrobutyricum]